MADENDTTEQELEEIADGAWGDGPLTRGLARVRLGEIRNATCPSCGAKVWNEKAHYVPGNFVTPTGWACPVKKSS